MTGSEDLIEVIECFSTAEAELARAHLAAEGIEARIAADDLGGMYPGWLLGRVQLLVRAEDRERATQILDGPARDSNAARDASRRQ
jgi:hypothetical protein